MINYSVTSNSKLSGTLKVPGDKSISHRAVMLSAISEGNSVITGFLNSTDCLNTIAAFKAMGVVFQEQEDSLLVKGVGKYGLKPPLHPLDLGNSGTAIRLISGLMSGQDFDSTLTGDESLRKRPMGRIIDPLAQMGAVITATPAKTPPLQVKGKRHLQGIDYTLPVASAQVKSCLLLAGLYAKGELIIHEPIPSRDHSERMLRAFGAELSQTDATIRMSCGQNLKASDVTVPGDISSAAFFLVGASIAKGSNLLLTQVGINPLRTGIIDILKEMGANITLENPRELCGEPVADIRVKSADLHGITINKRLVPYAIDEFPAIFIAAACAKGKTILTGAEELRVKESDRLHSMAVGLQALGVKLFEQPDGIIIEGGAISGGRMNSFGDHRIAMAFAMAGLVANGEIVIEDCANIITSFPNFFELAREAGLAINQ